MDADRTGEQLARIIAALRKDGLATGGDQLKTRPRGVPMDHPRLERSGTGR